MASVTNPSGAHTDTLVTDNEDGSYSVSYTPFEEGIHDLAVKFGGDHIPGSPFKVDVLPPTDASKCKAYGPGLERAEINRPAEFTVETKGLLPSFVANDCQLSSISLYQALIPSLVTLRRYLWASNASIT